MDKKYQIIEDPIHNYLRVDPIPTNEEVTQYYKQEFYSSSNVNFNDSSLEVQEEEKEFFNSKWESIHNFCLKHFGEIKNISLFDIGFGYAQALLYFKDKGYQISGLEPSFEGVEYAQKQGLKVYNAEIEDFSCAGPEKYDVVLLISVLEHLRNPFQTLNNIKSQLLKKNGLLVVDVPNEFNDFQTIANSEYGLNEWWICPPAHINYFSATTLKNLLKKCGYVIEHCEASFPLELFMLTGEVYVGNQVIGKQCHSKRVRFEHLMKKHGKINKLTCFYKALAELDLGRQVITFASYK